MTEHNFLEQRSGSSIVEPPSMTEIGKLNKCLIKKPITTSEKPPIPKMSIFLFEILLNTLSLVTMTLTSLIFLGSTLNCWTYILRSIFLLGVYSIIFNLVFWFTYCESKWDYEAVMMVANFPTRWFLWIYCYATLISIHFVASRFDCYFAQSTTKYACYSEK